MRTSANFGELGRALANPHHHEPYSPEPPFSGNYPHGRSQNAHFGPFLANLGTTKIRGVMFVVFHESGSILTETITSQKIQVPGFRISLCCFTKMRAKEISGIILYVVCVACCCGLCVPDMIIVKANPKENLVEFPCLSKLYPRGPMLCVTARG